MPVTSVQPEAPDNMLEALQGASINEERIAAVFKQTRPKLGSHDGNKSLAAP